MPRCSYRSRVRRICKAMKLSHLLESQSKFIGFYETTWPNEHFTFNRIQSFLEKVKNEFDAISLNEQRRTVRSTDFEQLQKFINDFGTENKPLKIFKGSSYNTGTETIHDFSKLPNIIETDLILNDNCAFDSLKGIHKHFRKINGSISCDGRKIKSHILGVISIEGVTDLSLGADWRKSFYGTKTPNRGFELEEIMEEYLPASTKYKGGDIFACQEALIEAGFDEYAQL